MKLIKLSNNSFAIRHNDKTYVGDLLDVSRFMDQDLEIQPDERIFAFGEMTSKQHNVADFGLNMTFIFSSAVDLGTDELKTIEGMKS